ncbi:outer membrane lipoprotein-sorting protein [Methanolobus vulcani]|uniref:DUF4367 domain-containing protein n=1 Tax=Methanolobus vulcani TaxID=38026 RepID=A0A7Z8KMS2_9EURY|nr:DUF4367 domain-containing protein [Methanolobus vulcani]TQD24981.1 DUF4367 domain-containing protein [Methanolobus vulcani]
MQRKLLIVLILLGVVLLTSGCTESEMSAKEITEKVQQKYSSLEDYSTTVRIAVTYGEDTQTMEYEILQKNPDKSKKTMILPQEEAGTIIVNNGGQTWRYDSEDDAYQIYDGPGMPGENEQTDYSYIIENFLNEADVSFLKVENYEGRKSYVLLSKIGDNTPEVKIWIDTETLMPVKLEAIDNDGSRGIVEYQDFKANTGIEDEEFMIPEDVEVVITKSLPNQPELTLEEAKNISNYNILAPSYLPEGSDLARIIVDNEAYKAAGVEGTFVGITYSNEETTINIIEEFNENRNIVMAPTIASHEKTEKITINGEEGELVAFINDNSTLDWEINGIRILISMYPEDREELIKVAESME